MSNQILAENRVLLYKLDKLRNHINSRIPLVNPQTKGEMEFMLKMIERFEDVPVSWELTEPIVPDKNKQMEEGKLQ